MRMFQEIEGRFSLTRGNHMSSLMYSLSCVYILKVSFVNHLLFSKICKLSAYLFI